MTPSKNSKTGREVIERMRTEGKVVGYGSRIQFQDSNGIWRSIKDADMAHKTNAVSNVGRAILPDIRSFKIT